MRKLSLTLCAILCSFSLLAMEMESEVEEQRLGEPELSKQEKLQKEECRERTRQIVGALWPESQDVAQSLLGGADIEPFVQESTDKILQFKVANQFGMNDGKASCGYQALYNSLLILKLIKTNDPVTIKEIFENLATLDKREQLFGTSETPWQKFILDLRRENQQEEHADWLRNEEIDKLIEAVCARDTQESFTPAVFVLGDIPNTMHIGDHPIFLPTHTVKDDDNKALKFIQEYQDPTKNTLAAFILYDSTPGFFDRALGWFRSPWAREESHESMGRANTDGHWYTAIVNKVNNQVQLITADSLFNQSRISDFRVSQLIEHLEGRSGSEAQISGPSKFWGFAGGAALIIVAVATYAVLKKQYDQKKTKKKHSALQQLAVQAASPDKNF